MAQTYQDIATDDLFCQWQKSGKDAGKREASLDNDATFDRTLGVIWTTMGITTTGQITLPVLNQTVATYASRTKANGERLAESSVRSFSLRVRTLCGYAHAYRYLPAERFYAFKLFKADEGADIPIWTSAQPSLGLETIHAYWDPQKHPEIAETWSSIEAKIHETRVVAWFSMALSIGARRGEMCHLRRSDIDRETKTIRFAKKTKGRKSRGLPLNARVEAALNEMDVAIAACKAAPPKRRPPRPVGVTYDTPQGGRSPRKPKPAGDWLFKNAWGEQVDGPSVLRQIQRYFAWGRAQGVPLPERFTLHSLRHKAISAALQVSPEHARQLAGHASVVTTQKIYGHTVTDDVRVTHRQTDQLERAVAPAPDPVPPVAPVVASRPPRRKTY